jgi:pimeloyl-ACP methyl ester carboxylesterase
MLSRIGAALTARTLAPAIDHAVYRLALSRSDASRKRSSAEALGPKERRDGLTAIAALYDRPEHFSRPETFFGEPPIIMPTREPVRRVGSIEVEDLSWPAKRAPYVADLESAYLAPIANHTARARLFRHAEQRRPTLILVHGYLSGHHAIEERAWPIAALNRRGLDVALFVLPFHGLRGSGRRPLFPGSDPRFTIEGFRQAIFDLGALVRHLRAQGAPHVGAMGMSLGGYTTALAATTLPDLDFAVPFVPLASIADFARDNGRLVGTPEERIEQHRLLEEAHRVVSPFGRPPRTPRERLLVLAGERDRVTPIRHAERIAAHFEAPLVRFSGGHILQVGRSDGFREVLRMLGRTGVLHHEK